MKMKMSWIKLQNDKTSFNIPKSLGFPVIELQEPEKTDETIKELIEDKYDTIVLSNEIAGFSEDILKKYAKSEDIHIIITPAKR